MSQEALDTTMSQASTPKRRENLRVHDREKLWEILLRSISSGSSLTAALAALPEPRPSYFWAKHCLRQDPALRVRYQTAMEERADFHADELVALADEDPPPGLSGSEASAWVQRQRMRIDTRKFISAKLRPRVWGDHVSVELNVSQQISVREALAQAERRVVTIDAEPQPAALLEDSSTHESCVIRQDIKR
jgi:hypothetical protein